MGIMDAFRNGFTKRSGTPQTISDALVVQGMANNTSMGPGQPLAPVRGYSQRPRATDYPIGVNANSQSRHAWGRTSYDVLRELMRASDIAQACKNHKIDELRSMEPLFTPMDGFKGDGEAAVAAARAAMAFPDRQSPWDEWLTRWFNSLLTFDSGPLYRRRNKAGEIIGLEVIDGSTVDPYVDGNGRRPMAPAPAFRQIIKGQSSIDLTAEDIIYPIFRPQEDSPYGMAPMETVLMVINTNMRMQWHFLQMYTDGNIPGGFMEASPDLSAPEQINEFQDYWNSLYTGDQSQKHKVVFVPAGSKFTQTMPEGFDKEFPKFLELKVCAAFGVVPQDLGITDDVNRATGETQTDTQFRVNTLPWVRFVEGVINRYLQHDLGLPVQMRLNTGRDKEDRLQEAQVWKILIDSGMASMDEGREELLGLPTDNERPIPRIFNTTRQGPVPLDSILAIAGKTDPETKAPATDAVLPYPFDGTPGLMPDKLPGGTEFKRAPQNPDDPKNPGTEKPVAGSGVIQPPSPAVAKEMTAGITSATGITGVDMVPDDDDDDLLDESAPSDDYATEMAKFRAFTKARGKSGKWRDFEFEAIPAPVAKHLNDTARQQLAKDDHAGTDARPKAGTPSWRDAPPNAQPQHTVDLALTDYWAPRIQDSLAELWAETDLQNAITATEGIGDVGMGVFRDVARRVLSGSVQPSTLDQVITNAWADAYNVGVMAAKVQMGDTIPNWSTWTPGMTDANQITALGWKEALDASGHTIKGITDTTMQRLANRIADGVNAGDPSDVIGRSLRDLLGGDSARAEKIAVTETARMLNQASMYQYQAMGVTQWDWIGSADACSATCVPGIAGGPYNVDQNSLVPAHPYCRCAASPHIQEGHRL